MRQTPQIVPRALEDDYGPGGSEGSESGEGSDSEYGERGRQGEEDDDGEMSGGSGDEHGDGSMLTLQPAIATAMERGAVVRAGEVSTAAVPDGRGNLLYVVLLHNTLVVIGLGGEVEGRERGRRCEDSDE